MATVRTVTLPDGSTYTMSDWGDYPLFSRVELDRNTSQDVLCYNYVQSQEIPGSAVNGRASLMDTNMPTSSQLPLRHQMVIFSVQMKLDEWDTHTNLLSQANDGALAGADLPVQALGLAKWNILTSSVYFVLLVEGVKPYTEGPITQYPHGGGLYYNKPYLALEAAAKTPTLDGYTIQNGEPGVHAVRRLAMPVHLGALEQFQGIFKFPRGGLTAAYTKAGMGPASVKQIDQVGKMGITVGLFGPRQRPIG
jgi:hypothetical protein